MKFFNIFSKKQEEAKELSLEEKIELLRKTVEANKESVLQKANSNCSKILNTSKELRNVIKTLRTKDVPEKTAKGSREVKNRFCKVALEQLDSLLKEKEFRDVNEIKNLLEETEKTILGLGGLTQKQMAHIRFFFEDDIKVISRKTKGIDSIIRETRSLIRPALDHNKIQNHLEKINRFEAEKKEKVNHLEEINNKVMASEKSLKEIEEINPNLNGTDNIQNQIKEAESEAKQLELDIISYLSLGKLLRKYKYTASVEDSLIDMYISEPSQALLEDNELKIIGFLKEALRINQDSKLESDTKRIEAVREIIENAHVLRNKRKSFIEKKKEIEALKIEMEKTLEPLREKRRQIETKKNSLENEINELKKKHLNIGNEIEALEKEILNTKQSIQAIIETRNKI